MFVLETSIKTKYRNHESKPLVSCNNENHNKDTRTETITHKLDDVLAGNHKQHILVVSKTH